MNAALTYRGKPISYTIDTVDGMAGEVDCSRKVTTFYVPGGPSWSETDYRRAQAEHQKATNELQGLDSAHDVPEIPDDIEFLLSPPFKKWMDSVKKAYTIVNPDAEPEL